MALKPFWNKKYHLGMKPEDVKAILNEAGNNVVADLTNELFTVSPTDIATLIGGSSVTYSDIPEAKYVDFLDLETNLNKLPRSILVKLKTGDNTPDRLLSIPFTTTNTQKAAVYMSLVSFADTYYIVIVVNEGFIPVRNTYSFRASLRPL